MHPCSLTTELSGEAHGPFRTTELKFIARNGATTMLIRPLPRRTFSKHYRSPSRSICPCNSVSGASLQLQSAKRPKRVLGTHVKVAT
jgi:hypothetical protein